MRLNASRTAVTNIVFASVVIVLLVVAASGFLLYAMKGETTMTETMTETTSGSMSETSTGTASMNETAQAAITFAPAHGQMFGQGWLTAEPIGNGSYVVSVYANGL